MVVMARETRKERREKVDLDMVGWGLVVREESRVQDGDELWGK